MGIWVRMGKYAWIAAATVGAVAGAQEQQVRPVEPEPALQVPLASEAVFLDLARAGPRVVAVGERGIVAYSDDDGATWIQAKVPVRGTLTSVVFLDDRAGFAVGHDAVIVRTDDGGASWSLVQFDPASQNVYLNIRFRDRKTGYVVGTNGQLLITKDGGATWRAQTLAVEEWYQNHLFDIAWTPAATVVAAEKGVLYRSADGLSDFTQLASPYEGSYFGALRLGSDVVLIYGMSGRMYSSADAGTTWNAVPAGTQQFLFDADTLADGRALVVGAGGTYCTVDVAGASADCRQRGNRVGFTAVLVDGNRVWLARENGGILAETLGDLLAR